MYDIIELNGMLVQELREVAHKLAIPNFESLKKQELIYKILDQQAANPTPDILELEKEEKLDANQKGRRKRILGNEVILPRSKDPIASSRPERLIPTDDSVPTTSPEPVKTNVPKAHVHVKGPNAEPASPVKEEKQVRIPKPDVSVTRRLRETAAQVKTDKPHHVAEKLPLSIDKPTASMDKPLPVTEQKNTIIEKTPEVIETPQNNDTEKPKSKDVDINPVIIKSELRKPPVLAPTPLPVTTPPVVSQPEPYKKSYPSTPPPVTKAPSVVIEDTFLANLALETEDETEMPDIISVNDASEIETNVIEYQEPETTFVAPEVETAPVEQRPNPREQNPRIPRAIERKAEPSVEFDGIVSSEGVLEIMPDGYGFLRSSDYFCLAVTNKTLWS